MFCLVLAHFSHAPSELSFVYLFSLFGTGSGTFCIDGVIK